METRNFIEIEIKEEYLFPSIVWCADMPNSRDFNIQITDEILNMQKTEKSIKKSNEIGWHSETSVHNRPAFSPIRSFIESLATNISASLNIENDKIFTIDALWVNVNPKYGYNALHDHPMSDLSGVYYVCADDNSGCLRFRDPRSAKRMNPWPVARNAERDVRHWDRVNYKPIPGRIIMFPSWLEHDVEPNLSNENRISISFNLSLKNLSCREI